MRNTEALTVSTGAASTPLFVQGTKFGGWRLFVIQRRAQAIFRDMHLERDRVDLSPGDHKIELIMRRKPDGKRVAVLIVYDRMEASATLANLSLFGAETMIGH